MTMHGADLLAYLIALVVGAEEGDGKVLVGGAGTLHWAMREASRFHPGLDDATSNAGLSQLHDDVGGASGQSQKIEGVDASMRLGGTK
jgi:hypothetical protein